MPITVERTFLLLHTFWWLESSLSLSSSFFFLFFFEFKIVIYSYYLLSLNYPSTLDVEGLFPLIFNLNQLFLKKKLWDYASENRRTKQNPGKEIGNSILLRNLTLVLFVFSSNGVAVKISKRSSLKFHFYQTKSNVCVCSVRLCVCMYVTVSLAGSQEREAGIKRSSPLVLARPLPGPFFHPFLPGREGTC